MNDIRVCLINPGWGRLDRYRRLFVPPPLNLAYIASSLENLAEVEIIDCYANELGIEECLELIRRDEPDVIGVIPNNYCDFVMGDVELWLRSFSEGLKSLGMETPIVTGGPFASVFPERALEYADFIVRGDQEIVFRNMIENFANERKLKSVKGLAMRRGRKTHVNKPFYVKNLDSVPFPSRDLLETNIYSHILIDKPMTTFLTARGCPYRCIYCSRGVYGPYRERSVENVLEELREIVDVQKIKNLVFYDDNFTINRKRTIQICELIVKEGIDMRWICATRVDLVDRDLLEKMRRAGCSVIAYGVESGDQKILNKMKKNLTINQTKKAFEVTKDVGIEILSYLIIGSPGETEGSIEKSFSLMKMLNPDYVQFNPIVAYPGSEIYGGGTGGLRGFTDDDLDRIRKKLYRKYYLRSGYILNQLKKIRSLGDIKRGLRAVSFIVFQK